MSQILVRESFLKGSMFVPNFMKIKRGLDFFLLTWYGMTRLKSRKKKKKSACKVL